MEFAITFLILAAALCAAFWGGRRLALGLFAAAMIVIVALYLHHATDVLMLSF